MVAIIVGIVAQACTVGSPNSESENRTLAPANQVPVPVIHDAVFAPLKRSEADYAHNGAAGPYFPERALRAGKWGGALIDCQVQEGGRLADCRKIAENPIGLDFANAALTMASRGRITVGPGAPVGEFVRVRVMFDPRVRAQIEH